MITLDVKQIQEILPHRPPMLLVDRIVDLVPFKSGIGIKNVTFNEEFFRGHFPGNPVCPGVCSVQMIRECAERAAGCRLRIDSLQSCRFMAVLTPDNASRLTIVVTLADVQDDRVRLTAEIRNGADVCVALKGEFGKH